MEHLSYSKLIDNIAQKFNQSLDDKENEIINYFNKNTVNIINEKKIAEALRRFIIRFLIIDNQNDIIDETSNLFMNLERKYLWDNKIFSKIDDNKFKIILQEYSNDFSFLQVKHSVKFYELIGKNEKNELNKFIKENGIKDEDKQTIHNPNNNHFSRNKRKIRNARLKE